jgi:hypothetical protein
VHLGDDIGLRRWQRRLPPLLAACALLPFVWSLGHPLFADDYIHLDRALELEKSGFSGLLRAWVLYQSDTGAWWAQPELEVRYLRPLVTLTFWTDHLLWGLRPAGYHLTNLFLHIFSTLLTYAIARRLLGAGIEAVAAALLFAVHPCHGEAILWVSGRTDLLAGFLVLSAFVLQLRTPAAQRGRLTYAVASLFCFVAALGAKESAAIYPALVLLHGWVYRRDQNLWTRLGPAVAPSIVLALYLGLRFLLFGGVSLPPEPFAQAPANPAAVFSAAFRSVLYLVDLVLFIPTDPVVSQPFWTRYWPLLIAVASLSLWLVRRSYLDVKDKLIRKFAVLFVPIALLPVLFITVGERFLYLPSVGYCLLVGAKFNRAAFSTVSARVSVGLVAALMLTVALTRSVTFGYLASASRVAIDDALHAVDNVRGARALAVIDLPSAAVLGFPHVLRVERPGRSLLTQIVTITPEFLFFGAETHSRIVPDGERRLRIETPPSLWSTYIARAFRGPRREFRRGEGVSDTNFGVNVEQVRDGVPSELKLWVADGTLLLRGTPGFRLSPLEMQSSSLKVSQ